jgi:uncharacterized DUF497 family protein
VWPFGGQQVSLFDWDDENTNHIASHGVSCVEAQQIISNGPFDVELQTMKDEERFVQLRETNAGRILVVVTTWRGSLIRVITAFDAPKAMKDLYLIEKGNLYGTDPQGP